MILAALLFAAIPPQVDQAFTAAFEKSHAPGAVLGIIIDGKLAYVKTAEGLLIDLNLTHATLAAMVGVGRPFLTTTLSRLERSGHLRSAQRRLVIRDPAGLKALAFGSAKRRRTPKREEGDRSCAIPIRH